MWTMRGCALLLAFLCMSVSMSCAELRRGPAGCGPDGLGTCVPFGKVLGWQRRGAACTGDSACDDPPVRLPVQTRLCCVPRDRARTLKAPASALA